MTDDLRVRLTVNGSTHAIAAEPWTRLLDVLRRDLRLTGTKEGCGEGECGACSVLVDGRLSNACLIPVGQLHGAAVITIEGLPTADAPRLAPLQESMLTEGGTQCGICTPGMMVAAYALLRQNPRPSLEEIREALAGNICRCTGYAGIYAAVQKAAAHAPLAAGTRPSLAPAPHASPVHIPYPSLAPAPYTSLARAGGEGGGEGAFRWTRPRNLAEALVRMAGPQPRPVPFAGGTDLMVLLQMRALPPSHFLDLWPLDELRGIEVRDGETVFGALTTYAEVAGHPHVRPAYPLLVQAARVSGGWAIQNRGTLGGNILNASPAADTPPALIAYGARVELASLRGRRWVPYSDFHIGYKQMRRDPDELLTRIALPPPFAEPAGHFYRKVGPRKAQAISKVCFAGVARWEGDILAQVRIGLGSVAPTVLEARETAAYLAGKRRSAIDAATARAILDRELSPVDDVRSTAAYRRRVAGNLLEQFLTETR